MWIGTSRWLPANSWLDCNGWRLQRDIASALFDCGLYSWSWAIGSSVGVCLTDPLAHWLELMSVHVWANDTVLTCTPHSHPPRQWPSVFARRSVVFELLFALYRFNSLCYVIYVAASYSTPGLTTLFACRAQYEASVHMWDPPNVTKSSSSFTHLYRNNYGLRTRILHSHPLSEERPLSTC